MKGGKRAAQLAMGLVIDLAERLDTAGVPADQAPSLDAAVDMVWPLAVALARLEKTAAKAGRTAAQARERLLDAAVAAVSVPAAGVPGDVARTPGAPSAGDWRAWESELAAAGESEAV